MKMREDIRPVTYLKSKAADLLAQQLNKTHRPVVITPERPSQGCHSRPRESYERTKIAVGLVKLLVQGEEDVRLGKTYDQRRVVPKSHQEAFGTENRSVARRRKYRVQWTRPAAQDLESIVEFIARDNIANALQVLKKMQTTAATLARMPGERTSRS